jgi:hypothetical protein
MMQQTEGWSSVYMDHVSLAKELPAHNLDRYAYLIDFEWNFFELGREQYLLVVVTRVL